MDSSISLRYVGETAVKRRHCTRSHLEREPVPSHACYSRIFLFFSLSLSEKNFFSRRDIVPSDCTWRCWLVLFPSFTHYTLSRRLFFSLLLFASLFWLSAAHVSNARSKQDAIEDESCSSLTLLVHSSVMLKSWTEKKKTTTGTWCSDNQMHFSQIQLILVIHSSLLRCDSCTQAFLLTRDTGRTSSRVNLSRISNDIRSSLFDNDSISMVVYRSSFHHKWIGILFKEVIFTWGFVILSFWCLSSLHIFLFLCRSQACAPYSALVAFLLLLLLLALVLLFSPSFRSFVLSFLLILLLLLLLCPWRITTSLLV